MKIIIFYIICFQVILSQDTLFWFDMNSVLDPPPKTPKVMDGIFGTSRLKVLDSLKNFRRSSSEGFRLQIFETVSKHSADTTLAYFQKTLEDTVYLIFEAPLYKLHFGNFLTKKEAEIQKIKLNRLGFKDIWIVRSRIHQN